MKKTTIYIDEKQLEMIKSICKKHRKTASRFYRDSADFYIKVIKYLDNDKN